MEKKKHEKNEFCFYVEQKKRRNFFFIFVWQEQQRKTNFLFMRNEYAATIDYITNHIRLSSLIGFGKSMFSFLPLIVKHGNVSPFFPLFSQQRFVAFVSDWMCTESFEAHKTNNKYMFGRRDKMTTTYLYTRRSEKTRKKQKKMKKN